MVSVACLVGRYTILVCFFSPENTGKEKGQMDGKLKSVTGRFLARIHLSRFVSTIICPVPEECFFVHLFRIGWPCKHYNFQSCLRDNLVPRMLEMAFQSFQISKFSDPPRLTAPCSYSRLLFSNQLPTSNFIETPA